VAGEQVAGEQVAGEQVEAGDGGGGVLPAARAERAQGLVLCATSRREVGLSTRNAMKGRTPRTGGEVCYSWSMRRGSQREWVKQQRADKIRHAQEVWKDKDYGITISERPRGLKLTWDQDLESFSALMGLHQLRRLLVELEDELVVTARAQGIAWDEIGWALGISREGVRKRHPNADRDAQAAAAGGEVQS
jgi:hypothetical protein